MNLKYLFLFFVLMLPTIGFADNECYSDNAIAVECDSDTTSESQSQNSPISYKVFKDKYIPGYLVNFWNNTSQKLEVYYQYLNESNKWVDNYVRIAGNGNNKNNNAGPYGKIRIIDVYPPRY